MTLIGQLFGQVQDVVTIVSFAAGLLVYAPWLIALLAVALMPAFLGETHFNAQSYSLNLRTHARAARTRLRPANRRQRRDGQGSEDLRPQRVPDRALPPLAGAHLPPPTAARDAARRLERHARCGGNARLLVAYASSSGAPCMAISRSAI